MPLFTANLDSVGSGRWIAGGDGNSGVSSGVGLSRRLWRVAPRTASLKVKPPQAAVTVWRPAWCFGLGNLEISFGDYRLALGLPINVRKILDVTMAQNTTAFGEDLLLLSGYDNIKTWRNCSQIAKEEMEECICQTRR